MRLLALFLPLLLAGCTHPAAVTAYSLSIVQTRATAPPLAAPAP